MHFLLIGMIVLLVLIASYFDLRLGIGLLAGFIGIGVLLVFLSGFRIFGGSAHLQPEMASIEFFDASHAYAGTWQIRARLTNKSDKDPISEFIIRVRALDCPSEDSAQEDCVIISDSDERIQKEVPAEQARDFDFTTTARNIQPRGTLNWVLDVSRLISH